MIRDSILNFLKSCKYFPVLLGTMFLGILTGVSAAGRAGFDLPAEWTQRLIAALDLGTLFAFLGTGSGRRAHLVTLFLLVGFAAGYSLLRRLIRRDIARRSLRDTLLAHLLHCALSLIGIALGVWGVFSARAVLRLVPLAILLFEDALALLEAYFLYARKKVAFGRIVTLKNMVELTVANTAVILLSVAVTAASACVGPLVALFVGMAFISIAIIVTELNAESFVLRVVCAAGEAANARR